MPKPAFLNAIHDSGLAWPTIQVSEAASRLGCNKRSIYRWLSGIHPRRDSVGWGWRFEWVRPPAPRRVKRKVRPQDRRYVLSRGDERLYLDNLSQVARETGRPEKKAAQGGNGWTVQEVKRTVRKGIPVAVRRRWMER